MRLDEDTKWDTEQVHVTHFHSSNRDALLVHKISASAETFVVLAK